MSPHCSFLDNDFEQGNRRALISQNVLCGGLEGSGVAWGNAGPRQAEPWGGKGWKRKPEFKEEKLRPFSNWMLSCQTGATGRGNGVYLLQSISLVFHDQIRVRSCWLSLWEAAFPWGDHTCVQVCTRVCMCTCVYMYTCVRVNVEARGQPWVSFFILFEWGSHWVWSSQIQPNCLANEPRESVSPPPECQGHRYPAISVSIGNLNSGSHACVLSPYRLSHLSNPLKCYFKKDVPAQTPN